MPRTSSKQQTAPSHVTVFTTVYIKQKKQVQTNHQGNSLDPIGKPKHVYWQLIQVKTSQHIGKNRYIYPKILCEIT